MTSKYIIQGADDEIYPLYTNGRQRMLILQASDKVGICEIDTVSNLGRSFGMSVCIEDVASLGDLNSLRETYAERSIDVIYLCGHADTTYFGGSGKEDDRKVSIPWPLISATICQITRPDSLMFLAACKGGSDEVAYDLFAGCNSLAAIVGPADNVDSSSLLVAFHLQLFDRMSERTNEHANQFISSLATQQSINYWAGQTTLNSPMYQTYIEHRFQEKYRPTFEAFSEEDLGLIDIYYPDFASYGYTTAGSSN